MKNQGFYNKKDIISKKFDKIGMICGGSGIAPMFQLINAVLDSSFFEKKIGMSLLYAAKTLEEMSFLEDLANYDLKGKVNFFPVLEYPNSNNWNYGTGKITPEMIYNLMPDAKGK